MTNDRPGTKRGEEAPAVSAPDWLVPRAPGPVSAVVRLPGSKSLTNRALVLAALADRPTVISRPLVARDTQLMADALRALGCRIEEAAGSWLVEPVPAVRQPRAAARQPTRASVAVDVGNAGTVLRFVPPVAALAAADVTFRGDPRMSERPVGPLLTALRTLGVTISDTGTGAVPFVVRGRGSVPGGTVTMDASSSSQLVSGLLLASARFGAGAEIRHVGPPVPSLPHIDMTIAMLRAAGVDVRAGAAAGPPAGGARPDDPDRAEHDEEHLARAARPDPPGRDRDRTRPVQRLPLPRSRAGDGRRGHRRRLASRQPATGRPHHRAAARRWARTCA